MDYEGQKLAELLFYWIIISFGAAGWFIGYVQEDFKIVFNCWLVGVAISVLVCLIESLPATDYASNLLPNAPL